MIYLKIITDKDNDKDKMCIDIKIMIECLRLSSRIHYVDINFQKIVCIFERKIMISIVLAQYLWVYIARNISSRLCARAKFYI